MFTLAFMHIHTYAGISVSSAVPFVLYLDTTPNTTLHVALPRYSQTSVLLWRPATWRNLVLVVRGGSEALFAGIVGFWIAPSPYRGVRARLSLCSDHGSWHVPCDDVPTGPQ